jgi:allophanate hydrolase
MSATLTAISAGPAVTVQDAGRPGFLASGLSRGGAADRLALTEGAALMGLSGKGTGAALEMAGMGGSFEVDAPMRFALTGAPMRADLDGEPLAWNAVHRMQPGQRLEIGAARSGVYGYLHPGGGIATEARLGARATHVAAGLSRSIAAGDRLPVADDPVPERVALKLAVEDRFQGGEVRVVPSLHSALFAPSEIERLQSLTFRRDARGNRMGVRLIADGAAFGTHAGLSILSEVITAGDIQIVGDGAPFVLLADCQTTGGYPRIASVLPCDLPRIAQAPPGSEITFRMVSLADGTIIERNAAETLNALPRQVTPVVLRPEDLRNLLSYQLISGVTAGRELEPEAF